jgi:signal transduction histidine kinase
VAGEMVADCVALIDHQAVEQGLKVVVPALADDEAVVVRADEMRLREVLLNLLTNALKYNTTGREVRIGYLKGESGFLRFEVADDGPGIPEAKQKDLFTPFNRLGMEAKGIDGTGIGLTISKQLVGLMGGRIGFENADGGGALFWFELPLADQAQSQA